MDEDKSHKKLQKLVIMLDYTLESDQVHELLFLLSDFIERKTQKKDSKSPTVYEIDISLEKNIKDYRKRYDIFVECLFLVGRFDLIRKIGIDKTVLQRHFANFGTNIDKPSILSPFFILLHQIAMDITDSDLPQIRLLVNSYISTPSAKRRLNECATPLDIFTVLVETDLISPRNILILQNLFTHNQQLKNKSIMETLERFSLLGTAGHRLNEFNIDENTSTLNMVTPTPGSAPPAVMQVPLTVESFDINEISAQSETGNNLLDINEISPQNETGTNHESPFTTPEDYNSLLVPESDINILTQETTPHVEAPIEPTHSEAEAYDVTSRPRGICAILNNESFSDKQMFDREGSEKDVELITQTFKGYLDFEVVVFRNETANHVLHHTIPELRDMHKNKKYDCFVFFVLSHGSPGAVYGCDSVSISIRKILESFLPRKCPELSGKPKLFFIQACQGAIHQTGHRLGGDMQTDGDRNELGAVGGIGQQQLVDENLLPQESDFLLGMATVQGYVSYRSRSRGSWYIRVLCETLRKHAYGQDLLSMLTIVNNKVSKESVTQEAHDGWCKQVPQPSYTLRKKLFFKPDRR